MTAASLAGHDLVTKLSANLTQEHNVNMEFTVFMYKNVVDLLQVRGEGAHALMQVGGEGVHALMQGRGGVVEYIH